jgi:hypothetical protein
VAPDRRTRRAEGPRAWDKPRAEGSGAWQEPRAEGPRPSHEPRAEGSGAWRQRLAARLGVWRSLLIYRAIPWRGAQLRRFYRRFVPPGGLAFDIGAHVGNRVDAFRALGARVVALEPQPAFTRLLQRRFGADPRVTLCDEAAGRAPGKRRCWPARARRRCRRCRPTSCAAPAPRLRSEAFAGPRARAWR